ncbi:MAG: HD domain-containing protein [Flavobacteriaceae bacterium]|uniref:HD domain-containing protein n=1 Tax=Flavobacterium kayseriense TaxID=2764714 RepID=A0ABR7J8V4_9FLAO|nr:HD domain-containing protein [Flavobacterium kayseriense]MBC5841940.1 HD domain-containing protein [Flavobacterium kayseriense]MBC5848469.1 HD domain-containing protein [Flavobacterium kayseriense]MBU0942014.1 HD domain-containing protein [Bacteroidota bacterium]MBX9888830.1 HD domain-containing protein [Flavobacteriaceae bacterium]
MSTLNKLKIFNDPIYGFITIPNALIYDLIQHPYFQRLRRISQMGLSYLVYPGANHTRFHHALGCMHLMQKAVDVLRFKGVTISPEEENALYIAILLHDIGHGPFSHAMERSIVEDVHHEQISLLFMHQLNKEFGGQLNLAIQVFEGDYHRKFMLQLISSQLDMDRMDYLKRDSFYSGVAEGNVNSERLIQMMNVVDDFLVIEEKGIYSVEKFLMSRRLMYWQAYLHKTSLVAELILTKILKRAKELTLKGITLPCSTPLQFFLENKITFDGFNSTILDLFSQLDDFDIISALKGWQRHDDYILSTLSGMIINRDLLKIKLTSEKVALDALTPMKERFALENNISLADTSYFIFKGKIKNQAYSKEAEPIRILKKDRTVEDVIESSDQLNLKSLSKSVTKYYICFPKQLI